MRLPWRAFQADLREPQRWHHLLGAAVLTATLPCQSTTRLGAARAEREARHLWGAWTAILDTLKP
eukprot:1337508-Alexandrium_andersonii.AAC.1